MQRVISLATVVLSLSAVCDAQPAQPAQPFDLRGIKLGITLEEFKRLPIPDHRPGSAVPSVICEVNEKGKDKGRIPREYWASVREESEAGAFGCGFFISNFTYPYLVEAPVLAATVKTYPGFFFIPDAAKAPRLYRIEILSDVKNWAAFWEGFTGRYGPPTTISRLPIQNRMGTTFDNIVAVWEGAESSILLKKRSVMIDETRIEYEHKALLALIRSRALAKKGHPKDNL